MTEEEWLISTRVDQLVYTIQQLVRGKSNKWWGRKYRLIAAGCFRLEWNRIPDELLRDAVVAAEQYADGNCGLDAMKVVHEEIIRQAHWLKSPFVEGSLRLLHREARRALASYTSAFDRTTTGEARQQAIRREGDVVRDLFGNPFHPVTISPAWRTDTAVSLARGMYESRDFGAMPILADALQDAGCDKDDILNHCRDADQVHVRGCWVVDLVLGKA